MNGPQILKLMQAATAGTPVAAKLKKATQDMEAIFVKDLLAAMRKTAPKQSFGGSSLGGDMYQDLFDQAIAEASSRNGSLGVGQSIYRQMAPVAVRTAIQNAIRHNATAQTISTVQGKNSLGDRGRNAQVTEKP